MVLRKDEIFPSQSTSCQVVVPMDDGFRVTYTRVPIPIPLMSDSDFCCGDWC